MTMAPPADSPLPPEQTPSSRPGEEEFMAGAWAAYLLWASKQPQLLLQFTKETGKRFATSTSLIEKMVDQATGFTETEKDDIAEA